ncbi:hypothetical protein SNEBB_004933 [Seison nebaliae]|nr:hypothetical protein SNEBB_004933 [Seison nebaliae]
METEYRNVVPKSEFEELSKNFNDLNEEVKLVKEHVDEITTENDRLITAVDTLTTERDEYYNESETLKRTSTPRPQWDKYGEMFSNKQEWKKAVENDSSIVLLDNLLNDLTSIETHPQQQFQPNETEQNVPIFLKTTDSIYNRRLSQRDAHYFIKQFWIERIKNRSSIEDFVEHYWNYSKSKFPSESMALEWTYNINVTCKRLKNNVFLQLFWRISNDKEEEYSYYHFKNCLVYLEEQLLEEEKSLLRPKSAEQEKTLQLKSVQDIIMKAFPEKSMTDTRKLTEILKEKFNETEMNAQIPFQQIFVEEDDDRLPDFHSTFLEQIFTEKNKYVNNYFEKYFQNENHLTKEKFLETIKQYDEKLSELELERYVKWLFPTNIDRLNLLTGKTKCLLMCIFPHREEVVDEKVDDEEIVQNESEIN